MRKILWAAGGIVALGLLGAHIPAASAGTLGNAAPALAGPADLQVKPENVYWVRRCWRERRWWGGRWHWVTRCGSIWVEPPRPRPFWGPPPPRPYWW
ncbi:MULTISPECIES: hypothetical protein [unclassified Xanthobacter]|uniref:hypothetical protein n=1 Tax=unclassified Xanthobacter TaxID=2623496 RepID=UPI001F2345FB|nr:MULTISPECIES: hypothetical protein [unclassified Xanthobacter]